TLQIIGHGRRDIEPTLPKRFWPDSGSNCRGELIVILNPARIFSGESARYLCVRGLFSEVWQHRLTEEFGLPRTIISPDLQHDVCTSCRTVVFDALNAFVRRARDSADFAQ